MTKFLSAATWESGERCSNSPLQLAPPKGRMQDTCLAASPGTHELTAPYAGEHPAGRTGRFRLPEIRSPAWAATSLESFELADAPSGRVGAYSAHSAN